MDEYEEDDLLVEDEEHTASRDEQEIFGPSWVVDRLLLKELVEVRMDWL
jgi:hypothetical protein